MNQFIQTNEIICNLLQLIAKLQVTSIMVCVIFVSTYFDISCNYALINLFAKLNGAKAPSIMSVQHLTCSHINDKFIWDILYQMVDYHHMVITNVV